MEERRAKGLCFNCDSKYIKGHKCGENTLFYIDYEEEEAKKIGPSQAKEIEGINFEEITPTIYCD